VPGVSGLPREPNLPAVQPVLPGVVHSVAHHPAHTAGHHSSLDRHPGGPRLLRPAAVRRRPHHKGTKNAQRATKRVRVQHTHANCRTPWISCGFRHAGWRLPTLCPPYSSFSVATGSTPVGWRETRQIVATESPRYLAPPPTGTPLAMSAVQTLCRMM